MILIYSGALGLFSLAIRGVFSRPLVLGDVIAFLAWMVGAFLFMPLWLFIRGKTSERTLTVSPEGISTDIGSLEGQVPWSKVKLVEKTGRDVLIVGAAGNAFFIPSRVFQGPEQQTQFIAQIDSWRNAERR